MTEFNSKKLEKKLNQIGREIQSFFDNIIPDEELDILSPRADFSQTSEGYEIFIDLPGMGKSDIKVELLDNLLTVKGERSITESEDHIKWLRRERHYGRFSRSFPVPGAVNKSGIKASFKDGVLLITVQTDHENDTSTTINID